MVSRIIVKETPHIREQINKHKKFLEKPDLFNHAAMLDGQVYYNVQYWRWGKSKAAGYLILRSDGSVPPLAEARPVVRLFMSHNNAVISFTQDFARDKEKPVWMYQQKRDCLQELLPFCEHVMDAQTRQDAEDLIEMCQLMVNSVEELRAIYERGMHYHEEMLARNYTTIDDEKQMRDALLDSDYILYRRLRKQCEVQSAVDRIYHFFASSRLELAGKQSDMAKKLVTLLRDYRREELWRIMKQSIKDMEVQGVPYQDVLEMRQAVSEFNEKIFHSIMSSLRNP
ncbi:hypothetical protein [Brevibacillus panacihumi]|uniref:hypothetical protein n=1 Tax=Brevibacillus panacihumi TaxID=497735 RepID=UPI003D262B00